MSAPNTESLAGQGEFHSKKPGSEPLTHKGHKPGVKVGNDAAPEFSAEAHEPGTAPSKNTHKPNPANEIPGASAQGGALDTLPGATSGSVHNATQFGKPAQGDMSAKAHSDNTERRTGLEGHLQPGQSATTGDGSVEDKGPSHGG